MQEKYTSLYPMPPEFVRGTFSDFIGFSDEELSLIEATNLHMLDEGNPIRYVLEFGMRPELAEGNPLGTANFQQSYRAGAVMGASLVRKRLAQFEDQHVDTSKFVLTPEKRLHIEAAIREFNKPKGLISRLPVLLSLNNQLKFFDERYNSARYIGEEELVWVGLLMARFCTRPFVEIDPTDKTPSSDDYVMIGFNDTLRLYNLLENKPLFPKRPQLQFDPKKHIPRHEFLNQNRKNSGNEFGEIRFDVERGDMETDAVEAAMGPVAQSGGYKGMVIINNPEAGMEWGMSIKQDWGNKVPVGAMVTHLRRQKTGFVMTNSGKESGLIEVCFKDTVEELKIRKTDAVVFRYRDGSFMASTGALTVTPDLALNPRYFSGNKGIEIMGLCRAGEYLPITETDTLTEEDKTKMQNLTFNVTQAQKAALRRKGSLTLKILDAQVSLPLTAAVIYSSLRYGALKPAVDIPVIASIELGIFGLLHKNEKRFMRRLLKARQQLDVEAAENNQ